MPALTGCLSIIVGIGTRMLTILSLLILSFLFKIWAPPHWGWAGMVILCVLQALLFAFVSHCLIGIVHLTFCLAQTMIPWERASRALNARKVWGSEVEPDEMEYESKCRDSTMVEEMRDGARRQKMTRQSKNLLDKVSNDDKVIEEAFCPAIKKSRPFREETQTLCQESPVLALALQSRF